MLASAVGATVQGCAGFGLVLVAGPALVAVDTGFVPGPLLVMGQFVNARHILIERRHLDRSAWQHSLLGLPVGLAAGLVVVSLVTKQTLALIVGVLTAAAASSLLCRLTVRRTRRTEVGAGLLAAFCSVAASLPGPPLAIAFSDMDGPTMRATSASLMMVIAAAAVAGLAATGNFGTHEAELMLRLLPGTTAGLALSRRVRPMLDRNWFRPSILTLALISGLALAISKL